MPLTSQQGVSFEPTNQPFAVSIVTTPDVDCSFKSFSVLNTTIDTPVLQIEGTGFYTPLGVQYKTCHQNFFISPLQSTYWQVVPINVLDTIVQNKTRELTVTSYHLTYSLNETISIVTALDSGRLGEHLADGYTHLYKNLHRLERSYIFSRHSGVAIFKIVYEGKRPLYLFHFGKFPPGLYAGTIYHVETLEKDTIFSSVLNFFETYTPGFWLWNNVLKLFHVDLDSKIKHSYDVFRDMAWDFLDEATRDMFLFFLVYVTSLPILGPGLVNLIISGVVSLTLIYLI